MKQFLIFLFIATTFQGGKLVFKVSEGSDMIYSDNLDQIYIVNDTELKSFTNLGKEKIYIQRYLSWKHFFR